MSLASLNADDYQQWNKRSSSGLTCSDNGKVSNLGDPEYRMLFNERDGSFVAQPKYSGFSKNQSLPNSTMMMDSDQATLEYL